MSHSTEHSTVLIPPAVHAARKVAAAAMQGPARPHGPVDTIVFALGDAGLLQSPETAAELDRLRRERTELNGVLAGGDEERALLRARLAELEPYETLHPQQCTAGQHRGWFADGETELPCPWCRIAELEAAAGTAYRATRGDITLGTFMTREAAAACCETHLRQARPGAVCVWMPADGDQDVIELDASHPGAGPGYTVTTITVDAVFDPEADA